MGIDPLNPNSWGLFLLMRWQLPVKEFPFHYVLQAVARRHGDYTRAPGSSCVCGFVRGFQKDAHSVWEDGIQII